MRRVLLQNTHLQHKINRLKPYFPAQANRWMDNPFSSKFKDEGFALKSIGRPSPLSSDE
jgi:hypothetical protein